MSIFGRTELRIGPSRAKNCQEVDFEVRFSLEASKPAQKGEKRFPRPKNLAVFILLRQDFSVSEIVFRLFGLVLGPLAKNRPQNKLPGSFLL